MSEREPYYYPSPFLNDQSSLLFMGPDVCRHTLYMSIDPSAHQTQSDPFPVGGGQDAQQVVPSCISTHNPPLTPHVPLVVFTIPR